jgi:FKBP-type peptidyl-prolyl cis-trans isomerase SlyD
MKSVVCVFLALLFSVSTLCLPAEAAAKLPIQAGREVSLHYTLVVDGQTVDSTKEREPLTFVHGQGQLMPGLSAGIEGLKPGQKKSVTVPPEQAYGEINPQAIVEIPRSQFPAGMNMEPGMTMQAGTQNGGTQIIRIREVKSNSVVVDMNHPLAGKTLRFDVEIISVKG